MSFASKGATRNSSTTTASSCSLASLQTIRSILSVIIRWRRYSNGRPGPGQCSRCQNFGHGTRNCRLNLRCATCALPHLTTICPSKVKQVIPAPIGLMTGTVKTEPDPWISANKPAPGLENNNNRRTGEPQHHFSLRRLTRKS